LTDKGKEYNSNLVLPPQDEKIIELQKKITELTKELQAQKDENKRERELREHIEKDIETQKKYSINRANSTKIQTNKDI